METLRISVVIPTWQRPSLLIRCIKAVISQEFDNKYYELIVVSDGKDPATSEAIAAMQLHQFPMVRYYHLPEKAGPAAARNFGLLMAQAELIAFTDDDCIPDKQWLNVLWNAYVHRNREEIAFSGKTRVPITSKPTDYEKNISRLAAAEFITANCACTKKALVKVGGFDERFSMAWREDSDLQFKLLLHNIPIVKLEDAVVTHPVRKAPWGISIKEERKGMFNALLYKKYPDLYKKKIRPAPPWHYYAIFFFLVMFCMGLLTGKPVPKMAGLAGWLLLTIAFTAVRLRNTSHSWRHVSEMVFTSAVIPILSLFWKIYGSWKYKVLLVR